MIVLVSDVKGIAVGEENKYRITVIPKMFDPVVPLKSTSLEL
jgi:hypothetical protein